MELAEPAVKFEFMRMPDTRGIGDYREARQVIPAMYRGELGGYEVAMYLNIHAPIAGGCELWGFPKRLGQPDLTVHGEPWSERWTTTASVSRLAPWVISTERWTKRRR